MWWNPPGLLIVAGDDSRLSRGACAWHPDFQWPPRVVFLADSVSVLDAVVTHLPAEDERAR